MFSKPPHPTELSNLEVETLGEATFNSNYFSYQKSYTPDNSKVMCYSKSQEIEMCEELNITQPAFEVAGPREKLFFDPRETVCGIVSCGGLCPGLNDVIRAITLTSLWQYHAKKVYGFRYGYAGLGKNPIDPPVLLTPKIVDEIHHQGGTILGSSRGPQPEKDIVETLLKYKVNILFVIGGDGTLAGGYDLAQELKAQNLPISVIGIPKTIDNDIYCCKRTFGYSTAVSEATRAIMSAHIEARAGNNGIGIVKLMGRDSGFIAAGATLANSDVNFCLLPEVPFELKGEGGLLDKLEDRLLFKNHAVIVAAEGAGQYLFSQDGIKKDASGNKLHKDIGILLKDEIKKHFKDKKIDASVKYIDPSYTIRSCPANADDSGFCMLLGKNAVHAGMAGKTNIFIGNWNDDLTHVPLAMTFKRRKTLSPDGQVLRTILRTTVNVSKTPMQ